jgi:hypothetical protein
MQQQLPGSSIPRRARGAVESMLDDALESGERKPNRPAKPLLIWSLLLAAGLIFYWFYVRDGAMFHFDAGWLLLIFAAGFLFAANRTFHHNRAWWAFMPWDAALLLEIRLQSVAQLAYQRSTAPLLSQYALLSRFIGQRVGFLARHSSSTDCSPAELACSDQSTRSLFAGATHRSPAGPSPIVRNYSRLTQRAPINKLLRCPPPRVLP